MPAAAASEADCDTGRKAPIKELTMHPVPTSFRSIRLPRCKVKQWPFSAMMSVSPVQATVHLYCSLKATAASDAAPTGVFWHSQCLCRGKPCCEGLKAQRCCSEEHQNESFQAKEYKVMAVGRKLQADRVKDNRNLMSGGGFKCFGN